MHYDKVVDEASVKKKPEMIQYFSNTKGGVDIMDQMVHNYTCKHQIRRWPMVLWYNLLDVATLNAYTIFMVLHPSFMGGVNNTRLSNSL
ncbi:hypothetical protein AAFF_G00234200 [Aldrovandia affinis]|uniref:PiggyBac transposable element-derived protein domain-containing protein n=1 Tax=Aldrovandia affinis TaxID=143900 RepID=A0AAD7SW24_9TELE|nr:hypothetical protein AAFF_G00234200 [Aldrovandia affinis]